MADTPLKTYHGACHCNKIKFSLALPEIKTFTECNCSICFRKAYAWVFPPAGSLVFEDGFGEEGLRAYEFAARRMEHRFCKSCGTGIMGKDMARTLKDVDIESLTGNKFDGATLEPHFTPHKFHGTLPMTGTPDSKTCFGSCHCGATTMALQAKELVEDNEFIQKCNCSICSTRGSILIYPHTSAFTAATCSLQPLVPYTFGPRLQEHLFCPMCGVYVYIRKKDDIPLEKFRKYGGSKSQGLGDEELKEKMKVWEGIVPVNLRCFEGVEWEKLNIKKGDWKGWLEGETFDDLDGSERMFLKEFSSTGF
ncbi:Mss4-like protein [Glarea lozoyensis ATCC 20868]|uniref:Mss4-like protein n=1 Tax=Glarea lozoyensis (strain ATCC 20868 / MF5171) TaxID=1116229 RepID=S3D195_GLAL2|nr:Mss4-like protein [Glarea lozoyensis ATCC 20868]EPE30934.1 Mss4-like protein [Glarea lozoyensis ATCC 20868]